MRRLLILITSFIIISSANAEYLFVEGKTGNNEKWSNFSSKEKLNLQNLLQKLSKSKTGKRLITKASDKAKTYGKTLYDVIESGKGSITDTTLVRRFSPTNPQNISYETRSKVIINKNLNIYDAVLDLAHELTHFVYRQGFNPYNNDFSLDNFIKNTVEGTGGEVQAFMMECKVLRELFPKKIASRYNCKKITDPASGQISRKLAVNKFYSLGAYFSKFKNKLDNYGILSSFPEISNHGVSFVSSAYGMPYPVAAYHEYMSVLSKVCENDRKRIAFMKSANSGRSIASTKVSQVQKDYLDRCSSVNSN